MHTIPASEDGQRLDRYLKNLYPHTPFGALQKLIRSGQIRVDGKRAKPETRLEQGQTLRLPPNLTQPGLAPKPREDAPAFTATKADLAELKSMILYEDNAILVLNKPAGLASQAGPNITKSLDRLLAAANPTKPPKLVHRLDRPTTGVMVAAKNRTMAAALAEQWREREPSKIYLALLQGTLKPKGQGWQHIRAPLSKTRGAGGARSLVDENGVAAHTSYQVLNHVQTPWGPATLVAARPHTGRMNQLRVHFAHLGHPMVGDDKYTPHNLSAAAHKNPPQKDAAKPAAAAAQPVRPGLFLHAATLTFAHPATGVPSTFVAPLPPPFTPFLPPSFPPNLLDLPARLG